MNILEVIYADHRHERVYWLSDNRVAWEVDEGIAYRLRTRVYAPPPGWRLLLGPLPLNLWRWEPMGFCRARAMKGG